MDSLRFRGSALLILLCLSTAAPAAMVAVDSSTDSNGMFRYVFSGGTDPYLFGGMSTSLSIVIPSCSIQSVTAPPGWEASTNETAVTLRFLGAYILGGSAVTVTLTSACAAFTTYDDLSAAALFPRGWVLGDVYTTNGTLYVSSATNDVTSVNVVGFERYALVGPMVPEPALWALLSAAALLRLKRR